MAVATLLLSTLVLLVLTVVNASGTRRWFAVGHERRRRMYIRSPTLPSPSRDPNPASAHPRLPVACALRIVASGPPPPTAMPLLRVWVYDGWGRPANGLDPSAPYAWPQGGTEISIPFLVAQGGVPVGRITLGIDGALTTDLELQLLSGLDVVYRAQGHARAVMHRILSAEPFHAAPVSCTK